MSKQVILLRILKNDKAAYGILLVIENGKMIFECRTIENLAKIFPAGTYPIRNEWSPRFKQKLWELHDVKGRGEIKIHVVNYYKDLEGCIGLGLNHEDIGTDKNNAALDGIPDLTSSAKAFDRFRIAMIGVDTSEIRVVDLY